MRSANVAKRTMIALGFNISKAGVPKERGDAWRSPTQNKEGSVERKTELWLWTAREERRSCRRKLVPWLNGKERSESRRP